MFLCNEADADEVAASLTVSSRTLVVCIVGGDDAPGSEAEAYYADPHSAECRVVAAIENPQLPSGPFKAIVLPPCGPAVVYPVQSLGDARGCLLKVATEGSLKFSCEGRDCAHCPLFVQP